MFDYIERKKSFLVNLGKYISYEIVTEFTLETGSRIRTVEELNSMDRLELAKNFTQRRREYFKGINITEEIITDIARYIDERIPQTYEKHLNNRNDKAPAKINTSAEEYGLIYRLKGSINEKKKTSITYATDKQISYLEHLATEGGFKLKENCNELTSSAASKLISFLLGTKSEPDFMLNYLEYDI